MKNLRDAELKFPKYFVPITKSAIWNKIHEYLGKIKTKLWWIDLIRECQMWKDAEMKVKYEDTTHLKCCNMYKVCFNGGEYNI